VPERLVCRGLTSGLAAGLTEGEHEFWEEAHDAPDAVLPTEVSDSSHFNIRPSAFRTFLLRFFLAEISP